MATAGNFPFKAGSSGLARHSGVALKIDKWCQEAFPLVHAQSLKDMRFPILSLEPSTATLLEYAPSEAPRLFVAGQSDAPSHPSVLIVNGDRDICSTFTKKLAAKAYKEMK